MVQVALKASREEGDDVVTPAAVLAEQYRGGRHDQLIDACLGRYGGIRVVETTRALARRIGNILARAGQGSADHVDATVVAVASLADQATIITSDPRDMSALVGDLPGIRVVPI
jgi:predicted nucleic acid-binding protein